ncbi:helix-turn-helix domain-containing protein [Aquimarina sp. RZ0]|uniref:helix-turn-helix domain-containing protein n=1 Tax=Aquimarina sp. RZ0 TaxID=2607730 RepID=UPI00165FAB62|nr:helix-turn-helix domain-containing protein [Aquimarina sp. RZ0]
MVLPIFLAIACLINIIFFLTKDYIASKNVYYKYRILSGGIGMISILALPLVILIFGDNQPVEHSAFSSGYFVVALAYVRHQIYNSKIEQDLIVKLQKGSTDTKTLKRDYIVNLYGLSSIEREIMSLIIKGYDYYKISKEIYISEETVLKNVSNIFRKIKIQNRAELISLIATENKENLNPETINNIQNEIPKNISDAILEALNNFEKRKGFLKKGLSLRELANELKTNTKYLSKTINDHKNLNFNTYINQLRINYMIKLLQSNPKLRNYNVKHLAEEVGFNNAEAFSRSFRKVTGKKPSNYLKELLEN